MSLWRRLYLRFTESAYNEGAEMGFIIGSLSERSRMYRQFDPTSKKKLTQAEVLEIIKSAPVGELDD